VKVKSSYDDGNAHEQKTEVKSSPIFTPKMDKSGKFSPQWGCLADICTIISKFHPPTRPSASNEDGIDVFLSVNNRMKFHA
jgi:hypothetical protein